MVDYKSGTPAEGTSAEEFADREVARYREQLRGYRDAVLALGPEPVRCALYFTGLGILRTLPELDSPLS